MPPKLDPHYNHFSNEHPQEIVYSSSIHTPRYQKWQDNYINCHKKIRVCIIGAGAAGLVNARLLKSRPDVFDVTVFEKSNAVGGTWLYNERIGVDEDGHPVHSSMYKNLRTNLPLSIMQFSDYECPPEKSGFVSHEDVLQYLRGYTKHFDLRPLIKFRHEILKVKRVSEEWIVSVRDIQNNHQTFDQHFDAVCVCNGRYSRPRMPDNISGLSDFKGQVIHVHDYRKPEAYTGQRVVVLGAGPSGTDISIELATTCEAVYLCHNLPEMFPSLPDNIIQISSSIKSIEDRSVIMKTGQVLEKIDTVFFATGYDFDFDFLDESCGITLTEEKGRVRDLYLHLINANQPSMAIWAVSCKVIPFPFYELQAKYFMKVLLNEIELPSTDDMIQECQEDFEERLKLGVNPRHAHEMTTSQMLNQYEDRLTSGAKIPKLKPVCKDLYNQLWWIRRDYLKEYKDWQFVIVNDHEFHYTKA